MCDCKRTLAAIILGGLVYFVVAQLLGMLTQVLLPFDWFSIGGMRSAEDPLLTLSLLCGFVSVIGAAIIYKYLVIKGKIFAKGIKFGVLMWVATSVPSAFIIYTTMAYPAGFYLDHFVFGFFVWVFTGMAIAWVYREKSKKKK